MKIALGCDHGGFDMKEVVKKLVESRNVEVIDLGCYGTDSVDYPDYARKVASRVSDGVVDEGILLCTSGIGMSIAANKFPRVRAALCLNAEMAKQARKHNNANILVLAGGHTSEKDLESILDTWFKNSFDGGRHERRIHQIKMDSMRAMELAGVYKEDQEIYDAFQEERQDQQSTINMIASENYASRAVREAQSSVMMNKYAEGYPGKRYYRGCRNVDVAETLAIDRAKQTFGADHANVQAHCGSSANMAVYFSVLEPGDTILSMSLAHGGHLTHGHKVNFSGRLYNIVPYGVTKETEQIDYDQVEALAKEHKPKLIIAGASAYPRLIDFERFRAIADSVGAYLLVDMAHIAGLVAGGAHPNPTPYCDFVTGTTHKTLRGPRGGVILCREQYAADIDKFVFPGMQGGPLMHVIAAKAICFHYVQEHSFREYAHQIVRNAAVMADELLGKGYRLVSGGTDNHLMLIDVTSKDLTGRDAATALERVGLIVNKNALPYDPHPPAVTSGIRIGTPAVTTRGMREDDMVELAGIIDDVLSNADDETTAAKARTRIQELAAAHPIP